MNPSKNIEYENISKMIDAEKNQQKNIRKKLRIQNLKKYESLGPIYFENKWPNTILENVCTILGRIGFHGLTSKDYTSQGPILLSVGNMSKGELNISSKITHITEEAFLRSPNIIVKKNDVLFSKSGTIGSACVVNIEHDQLTINAAINILRPSSLFIPKFLLYWFRTPQIQNLLYTLSPNTAQKNLYQRDIRRLNISIPSLKFQKQIVAKLDHILGELEEKKKQILTLIENNKERIDFFEKNWLIFTINNIIENHPDKKNWKSKILSDVCDTITSGGTPSRSNPDYFIGDIPWLKIGDLTNGEISNSKEKINALAIENSSTKLFPVDTVLFAMYGATIGKTGILKKECATNQAICGMICGESLLPLYLLYFLQSKYFEIRKLAEGGAQPNINKNKLENLQFSLPSLSTQKQIISQIQNTEKKFQSQKHQFEKIKQSYESRIKYLDHIQSSILDAAFSGKLVT